MSRIVKGLLVVAAAVGAIYAAKSLASGGRAGGDEATVTFGDGTTTTLTYSDIRGQEFIDIARKLVESGV